MGIFRTGFLAPIREGQLHAGIDIRVYTFGDPKATNPTGKGNPVFVVYDGVLGISGDTGFINVCHEEYQVCTYYAHLTDIPEKFANLQGCTDPDLMIPVSQGEFIGYMGYDDNSGIHLHFSVKLWDLDGRFCWDPEPSVENENDKNWQNMLDPLPYFGLESGSYSWMTPFPENQSIKE